MKKIIAMMLALMMVFALCACGGNGETADDDTTTFIMGVDPEYPPFSSIGEDGELSGFDIEVCQAACDLLGWKLEVFGVNWDQKLVQLNSEECDCIWSGMTILDSMKEAGYVISEPYYDNTQVLVVKEGSDIKSVDDLSSEKKIGVQLGTTGDIYASDDFGAEAVAQYDKGADAVQALIAGKVDCVIIDNEPAKAFVAANTGLTILETSYAEEDYAICFAKDNTELQTKVNDALKKLIDNGTVKTIVDKYISAE